MTEPVKLTRIFSSPKELGAKVDNTLIEGLAKQFPVEGRRYRLEATNFRPERKDYTHEDEKRAILETRSLTYPIRADLRLIDKETGKVVDEHPNFALMDSFHITNKHTLLYKGNNYTAANQLQLLPGVYTRFRDTGELESHFNTATGRSFQITLDPQEELFYIEVGSSKIPAAPLINDVFQVSPSEIAKYVPAEAWVKNLTAVKGKEARFISSMYQRMVSTAKQVQGASVEQMKAQLKESLQNSRLNEQTTLATLGKSVSGVTADAVLRALKNLVDIHKGQRPEDNRDSLQFKRVQNLPDFLRTRFEKGHQVVKQTQIRMTRELDRLPAENPKLKGNLSTKPYSKFFSNYLMESNLVATPEETNPIESIENVAKVTVLGAGEGGISSDRGVPMGARDIDPSHLGIIDPSRTPESGHAGIDQRFTMSAKRDDAGNLYANVRDTKGNLRSLSVHEMMNSVIGFPNQENSDMVVAQVKGELHTVPRNKVEYWLADTTDMYTVTTNLVPFLNSNHPGRLTMAGKAIPQALSLLNREIPLVQTTNAAGIPFVKSLAGVIGTVAPVAGTVIKIDSVGVTLRPDDGGKPVLVKAVKNLPFNMKGFHDDESPLVKEGDYVKKDQQLFESNYTRQGTLALGKNLHVAYLPWKGYNHEDGLVLSRSAADSLSSNHAYKVDYDVNDATVAKKSFVTRYYPGKLTKEQLANLDEYGYAKVGVTLKPGDPVYAVLERKEPTAEEKMLGRIHKQFVLPFALRVEEWNHDVPGTVVDAHTTGKQVRFIIRSVKPLEVGDKLTGLHGNKGIVSLILEDHQMPYLKETGKPVDILLNPASVTSRINFGQLMETAAAKIAQKTGKPYLVHNFDKSSNIVELKKELEQHGLEDSDVIIDPNSKKELGKILNGPQYFLKLYKTSDQNWSARNVGGYDNTRQPTRGGDDGSKKVGFMEVLGLLGSNARKNLKEISTVKSENNSEYWERFLKGEALPKPKTTFATQKFLDYLTASGIKTSMQGGKITATPLTNADILSMSRGEIKKPLMVEARNMEPERGGLFDPVITGGIRGTNWAHYSLAESLPNPIFERPIKSILGLTTSEYEGIAGGAIGVKKEGDTFHLHDIKSGAKIRTLKVNSFKDRVYEEEADAQEEDDDLDPLFRQEK